MLEQKINQLVKWEQNEIGRCAQFVVDTLFDIENRYRVDSKAMALRQLADVLKKAGLWEEMGQSQGYPKRNVTPPDERGNHW